MEVSVPSHFTDDIATITSEEAWDLNAELQNTTQIIKEGMGFDSVYIFYFVGNNTL